MVSYTFQDIQKMSKSSEDISPSQIFKDINKGLKNANSLLRKVKSIANLFIK